MHKFIETIKNPLKFRFFLIKKLPMAFLAGLRVTELTEDKCSVVIPFKYLTKNPFRSIYFACLSMAAEMATGVLSMMHVYGSDPEVSMLVVGMEARFFKKAVGLTTFTCTDGKKISEAIGQSKVSGEGKTVMATSTGVNEAGEKVAEFTITWSFKVKSK